MSENVATMEMSNSNAGDRTAGKPTWTFWTGWVLTALPVLMMVMSASMKLTQAPQMVQMLVEKFGYQQSLLVPLAIVELTCVVLYTIPQTAVLGAVLLSSYLGGAVATHVRVGDPGFATPALVAVLAWGGIFFRDERVRALLPLRRHTQQKVS